MKNYKLVSHDAKSFTVQHPDGSHFQIAKKGLSAKDIDRIHSTIPKIQHFDDGGVVQPDATQSSQPDPSNIDDILSMSQAAPVADASPNPSPNVSPQDAPPINPDLASAQPNPVPSDQTAPPVPGPNGGASGSWDPTGPVPASQQIANTPATQGTSAPSGFSQLQDAQGLQQQGIKDLTTAKVNEGNTLNKIYEDQAAQIKAANEAYTAKRQVLDGETEALFNNAVTQKVDPNRYWNNMSTGNKILASISMVLGGVGAGITGGPNQGLEVINRAINNDIDAQKANIAQGNNLLSQNLARTRNMDDAEALTRSQLTALAGAQVAQAQAKAIGPEAQANGKMLLGQLKAQALQANAQLAQSQAKSAIATGSAQQVNPELLSKDDRERLVTLPNGQQKLAYDSKSAGEVRDTLETVQPIYDQLDKLDSLGPSALVPGSKEYNKAQAIRSELIPMVNENAGLKRLSAEDIDNISKQIKDPTSFAQIAGGAERSKTLRNLIGDKLQSTLSNKLEGYKRPYVPKSATAGYKPN